MKVPTILFSPFEHAHNSPRFENNFMFKITRNSFLRSYHTSLAQQRCTLSHASFPNFHVIFSFLLRVPYIHESQKINRCFPRLVVDYLQNVNDVVPEAWLAARVLWLWTILHVCNIEKPTKYSKYEFSCLQICTFISNVETETCSSKNIFLQEIIAGLVFGYHLIILRLFRCHIQP